MPQLQELLTRRANRLLRTAFQVAPTAVLALAACLQAWREGGSTAARNWLGYAIVGALVLATYAAAGAVRRPSRSASVALGALLALAAWAVLSALWAPLPSLARDEGLLTAIYVVALAVPVLTLRADASRLSALGAVTGAFAALAVATALELRFGGGALDAFRSNGRMYFPITYVNAAAAILLVCFWPAVCLAARRESPTLVRGAALSAAGIMLAASLPTQSRGAVAALAASAFVVFAVCPARLRLAPPALLAAAPSIVLFRELTGAFTAAEESPALFAAAIRDAGGAMLWAGLAAAAGGVLYAALDRRLVLPPTAVRVAGLGAAATVLASAAVGFVAFEERVDEPRAFLAERWEAFKREPESEPADTHLLSPGSNRYDFWRVALLEFRDHPLAGGGSRSFGPAYLIRGESVETPARTHSLPLEVLGENGSVGFLLLAVGLGVPLAVVVRRRALLSGAAVLGAGTYWIVHASVDWTWTFPACGIPLFLLLGIALAGDGRRLAARPRWALAAAAALIALVAFAPVWLSGRYLTQAYSEAPAAAARDLDRARWLDPLSTEPLVAQAQLAASPAAAIAPLRRAAEQEPRSVRVQYLLGLALLEAGRKAEAREALERAEALFPRERLIDAALARTGAPG